MVQAALDLLWSVFAGWETLWRWLFWVALLGGLTLLYLRLFRRETFNATLRPIQIIGGSTVSKVGDLTRVPKRELVSVVQVGLQNRTLKIAPELSEAATLSRELQNFQVKITDAANDTYGAWREGTHDDLVLAIALAVWNANIAPFKVTERVRQIFKMIS